MSRRFVVIHEAEADFRSATEIADRVLVNAVDWLDDELIAHQREWIDAFSDGRRLTWKSVAKMSRAIGIRARGKFKDAPGEPDAKAARRAIRYVMEALPDSSAILLIRDQDDEAPRRDGLTQARDEHAEPPTVVIGFAVVEREAWVISGFDPRDDHERSLIEAERQTLGFDPRHRSHELTACKNDNANRSPKRVLKALTGDDRERERRCWTETSLDVLAERGSGNGLSNYMEEVRTRLAPLIGSGAE